MVEVQDLEKVKAMLCEMTPFTKTGTSTSRMRLIYLINVEERDFLLYCEAPRPFLRSSKFITG